MANPIREYGRLLYVVPSFTGRRDQSGDPVEYLVDLEPFKIWKRIRSERQIPGGYWVPVVQTREVIQPYACTCEDFQMRPLHPCKHIEAVVDEFFPEYYIP